MKQKYVIVTDETNTVDKTFPSYRDAHYYWTHSMNHLDYFLVQIQLIGVNGEVLENTNVFKI